MSIVAELGQVRTRVRQAQDQLRGSGSDLSVASRHVASRCVTAAGTYRYNAVPEPINRSNAAPAMDAGYVDEMQNQLHPGLCPPFGPPSAPYLNDFS